MTAISLLVFPSATSRRTCSSLGDSPSRAEGTCFDSRSPRWIRCSRSVGNLRAQVRAALCDGAQSVQ